MSKYRLPMSPSQLDRFVYAGLPHHHHLTPDMSVQSDQEIEWAFDPLPKIQKQALVIGALLGAGTLAEIGAGAAGLGSSLHFYHKLSQELNEDMEKVADSFPYKVRSIHLRPASPRPAHG